MLASAGVQAGFLVPTENILEKDIFDATSGLRWYLAETGYHDYASQKSPHKRIMPAWIVGASLNDQTEISMYRPKPKPGAKEGFPRIRITDIKKHCEASDLIALIVTYSGLLILNMSREENRRALADPTSSLRQLVTVPTTQEDWYGQELLGKLHGIGSLGFVDAKGIIGSNRVGLTVEDLLDIKPNSQKKPDYHGIEIKATSTKFKTRKNLFSMVPDWARSEVDGMTLLTRFGYQKNGRRQLYCTIKSTNKNTFNFALSISEQPEPDELLAQYVPSTGKPENLLRWGIPILESTLAAKHPDTFWITANERERNGITQFHYVKIMRTVRPMVANFSPLLAQGIIHVDLTLKVEPSIKLMAAINLLRDILQNGPMHSVDVYGLAKSSGINKPTLARAKRETSVIEQQILGTGDLWSLPDVSPQDGHTNVLEPIGHAGGHGYLFKIPPEHLQLLFPEKPRLYSLDD